MTAAEVQEEATPSGESGAVAQAGTQKEFNPSGEGGATAEAPSDAPESQVLKAETGAAEPVVTNLIFVNAAPQVAEIAAVFRDHLWSTKLFGGTQKDEAMETPQFITEEEVIDEEGVHAWVRTAASEPLGTAAWSLTVLRAPAPARSAVVVRMARHIFDCKGEDIAELESSLGVPLLAAKEERRKRERSSSPRKEAREPKEKKPRESRAPNPGREPTAAELARARFVELDAETREPVPAKEAVKVAITACMGLREVNSNQKGGGGCALYHDNRILLYSATLDLPEDHKVFVKERFEHMGRVFTAKTASTYRNVCDEIEGYLRNVP